VIVATNRAWKEYGRKNGLRIDSAAQPVSYLEAREGSGGRVAEEAGEVAEGIRAVVRREDTTPLKLAEEALNQRRSELQLKTVELEEAHTALRVSHATVSFHRKNLRKKFGLSGSSVNLQSHLLSLRE